MSSFEVVKTPRQGKLKLYQFRLESFTPPDFIGGNLFLYEFQFFLWNSNMESLAKNFPSTDIPPFSAGLFNFFHSEGLNPDRDIIFGTVTPMTDDNTIKARTPQERLMRKMKLFEHLLHKYNQRYNVGLIWESKIFENRDKGYVMIYPKKRKNEINLVKKQIEKVYFKS